MTKKWVRDYEAEEQARKDQRLAIDEAFAGKGLCPLLTIATFIYKEVEDEHDQTQKDS